MHDIGFRLHKWLIMHLSLNKSEKNLKHAENVVTVLKFSLKSKSKKKL